MKPDSSNENETNRLSVQSMTKDQIHALTDDEIKRLKFSELIWIQEQYPDEFDDVIGNHPKFENSKLLMKEFAEKVKTVTEPLKNVVFPEFKLTISAQTVEYFKSLSTTVENLAKAISSVIPPAEVWKEKAKRTVDYQFDIFLYSHQFPPCSSEFSFEDIMRSDMTYKVEDETTLVMKPMSSEFETFLLDFFSDERVMQIMEEWRQKDYLTKRVGELEEVVELFRIEKYRSVINLLLNQFEGILVDKLLEYEHTDWITQARIKKTAEWIFEKPLLFKFYAENVLDTFTRNEQPDFPLNRNAISHGTDLQYGTKFNAIRCIVLFNELVKSI